MINLKKNIVNKILIPVLSAILCLVFIAGCSISSKEWFEETIKDYYYYTLPDEAFEGDDFKQIAAKYLDAYSAYYTAEEYKSVLLSNAGSKSGIGLSTSFVAGKGIYVGAVVGNSPAYLSGMRAGEWLVSGSAGGEEVTFTSSKDFSNLVNSAGDGVNIKFTSLDGSIYTCAKSEYTATYAYMASKDNAWVFDDTVTGDSITTKYVPYLPEDTAYIRLSQFYGEAAEEFSQLVKNFNAEGFTSLILDLRSNGGGYVSVMQRIAYAFSGSTKMTAMLARDKYGNEADYRCVKVNSSAAVLSKDTKVYVLANSSTASASEALIGAMLCYGSLEMQNIFLSDYSEEYLNWLESSGQQAKTARSYGKGIMQSTYVNDSTKEALKLTTAQIYWPDKSTCIHDKGLTVAEGCTPVYAEWQHTKADEELQRVVEMIKDRNNI